MGERLRRRPPRLYHTPIVLLPGVTPALIELSVFGHSFEAPVDLGELLFRLTLPIRPLPVRALDEACAPGTDLCAKGATCEGGRCVPVEVPPGAALLYDPVTQTSVLRGLELGGAFNAFVSAVEPVAACDGLATSFYTMTPRELRVPGTYLPEAEEIWITSAELPPGAPWYRVPVLRP